VVDEHLFVTQHGDGLAILQHKGDTFTRISELNTLTNAWDVAVHGSHAFVADGPGGLVIIDVSRLKQPRVVGRIQTDGVTKSIAITPDGTTAYLAAGPGGLVVVDITRPTSPRILTRVDTPGTASKVSLSGNLLALADWNDARVYQVEDPANPRLVGTKTIKNENPVSRTVSVAMAGDTLFIGEWFGVYGYQVFPKRKAPDLLVREPFVHLDPMAPGSASSTRFRVENEGNEELKISQTVTTIPATANTTQSIHLSPGESREIKVIFHGSKDTPVEEGTIILCTNDPDEPEHRIQVRGNGGKKTTGKSAPDVNLNLLDGRSWKLSEQRGHPVLIAYFATF
jgi:hypothetical protein